MEDVRRFRSHLPSVVYIRLKLWKHRNTSIRLNVDMMLGLYVFNKKIAWLVDADAQPKSGMSVSHGSPFGSDYYCHSGTSVYYVSGYWAAG